MSLWENPVPDISAAASFLHIFRFSLSCCDHDEYFRKILSPEELLRSSRLVVPAKRDQCLRARGWLRKILSFYINKSPESICFKTNSFGKPSIDHSPFPICFNVSHSDQLGIIALANSSVGIDVERIKDRLDFSRIGHLYLSHAEMIILNDYPEHRKRRGFYRLWTGKESKLKMLGCGFMQPNALFPEDSFQRSFYVAPGYVAAVAMESAPEQIRYFNLLTSDVFK